MFFPIININKEPKTSTGDVLCKGLTGIFIGLFFPIINIIVKQILGPRRRF